MFLTCLIISYQKRFLCSFFFDVLCVVDVVVAGEIVTSRFNPFSARVKNIYNIHSSCGQSSLEVRPTCSRQTPTNCCCSSWWQCDQMPGSFFQCLAIYYIEYLPNSLKISQSRYTILPNTK